MKTKTKSTKEVLYFIALGLALFAGLSRHGARRAAAGPAFQEDTSILAPTITITATHTLTPTMTVTATHTLTPTMTITATPTPEMPDLTINQNREMLYDADEDKFPDPGDRLRYVITYGNTGQVVATGVFIYSDYDEGLVDSDKISDNGKDWGDYIEWDLGDLSPGDKKEVSFEVTINTDLSPGLYELINYAGITSNELFEWVETDLKDKVVVHTPTPTLAPTPTSTPIPTQAPTQAPSGPQSGIWTGQSLGTLAVVSLLSVLAISTLLFAPILMKLCGISDWDIHESMEVLRHGVFVVFIIFAVLILALGGGVKEDGAISILSAIVGYLFGRGTGRTTGTQPSAPTPSKESSTSSTDSAANT